MKFINTDTEHNQVLFELGLLDDDDDYQLFRKMQNFESEFEIDLETWNKYMTFRNLPV